MFGPGFLEKASKKIEVEKTPAKVTNLGQHQNLKRGRYTNDKSDLRNILLKGALVRCGNTKNRPPQPHTQFNKFSREKRYFHPGELSQRFLKDTKKVYKDKPADQ